MRYIKKITHKEIEKLWGFSFPLIIEARDKQLYLLVKKDGTPHAQGGGRYITEDELKLTDVQL